MLIEHALGSTTALPIAIAAFVVSGELIRLVVDASEEPENTMAAEAPDVDTGAEGTLHCASQ